MIIAGTGSRSLAFPENEAIFERVVDTLCVTLEQRAPEGLEIISGGAEGFDHALALAAFGANVPCHLFLPSPDYGKWYWQQHSQTGEDRYSEFEAMVKQAASVRYVCAHHHGGRANFIRNDAMIEAADKVWVWNPSSSGTRGAVRTAKRLGRPMFLWTPNRLV